jgi:hypothetical protein
MASMSYNICIELHLKDYANLFVSVLVEISLMDYPKIVRHCIYSYMQYQDIHFQYAKQ